MTDNNRNFSILDKEGRLSRYCHRMKLFMKIAHRGYSARYPENTLVAFAKALEAGADMIELDVRLSKDRRLVVIHDERIDRTSDGQGKVADMTLAELRRHSYANGMPGLGFVEIPTLDEVIGLTGDRVALNIEMKTRPGGREGMEQELAALLAEKDCTQSVIVSSFDHYALAEMKRIAPDINTGMLYDSVWIAFADECRVLGVTSVHPGSDAMDEAQLLWAKEQGLRVYAWVVQDRETLERFRSSGYIDGAMVNDLDLFY